MIAKFAHANLCQRPLFCLNILELKEPGLKMEQFSHGHGKLLIDKISGLRDIGRLTECGSEGPVKRTQEAQHDFNERTLAAAIFTYDRYIVPIMDFHA